MVEAKMVKPDEAPTIPGLTHGELLDRLRAVDPGACLVSSRVLRRVIKKARGVKGVGLQVPHRKCLVLAQDTLRKLVDPEELGVAIDALEGARVILIDAPEEEALAARSAASLLTRTWRLLFHARVHLALEARVDEGTLKPSVVLARIHALGRVEFDEIRSVLRHEDMLLPPHDDIHTYIEFVAVYLEMRYFAPGMLARYFPTLGDLDAVEAMITVDLDAEALLEATRLEGAPMPSRVAPRAAHRPRLSSMQLPAIEAPGEGEGDEALSSEALTQTAEEALTKGNVVRAILSFSRAVRIVRAGTQREGLEQRAREALMALSARLPEGLGQPELDATMWYEALAPLLARARNIASPEARVLFDLQRACDDRTRALKTLDLVGFARTLGRRGWRRELPHLGPVLACKHLRKARAMLTRVRVESAERAVLTQLMRRAVGTAEEALRETHRPRLRRALVEAGVEPRSLPEQVALDQLIEALLDKLVERGYFTMGELRDAVARSDLKLQDLDGFKEFISGDALLRIDAQLEDDFDGIYRSGEVYLRALQRFSALSFGTRVGRALVLWLVLPLLGAFVVLEGLQHLVVPILWKLGSITFHVLTPVSFTVLSLWLLGIINSSRVRSGSWVAISWLGQGLRAVFVDAPRWLVNLPPILALRRSRPYIWLRDRCFWPLLLAAPVALPSRFAVSWMAVAIIEGAVALGISLLFSTRAGERLRERGADWMARGWRRLSHQIIPGILRWLMGTFQRLLERVDRVLYRVDEWLRFRDGEHPASVVVKAVVGVFWGLITYVVRLYINLLIEPQVNPIKHFPVVTVSHKVILPMTPQLTVAFMAVTTPLLGDVMGGAFALATVVLLPGVFGFLAWEMKENWRLFDSNRAANLGPVMIGSHGETMVQLMKPGFHSGTLPKLYAKLRRAERRAHGGGRGSGSGRTTHKLREQLHHIEEDIARFIERALLRLLALDARWKTPLEVGDIRVASNRVLLELRSPGQPSAWISLAEQGRWLIASIDSPGWTASLDAEAGARWRVALAGFYKLCAVDLVAEQIAAALPQPRYDIGSAGLVVWADADFQEEYVYDLEAGDEEEALLRPQRRDGGQAIDPEVAPQRADALIFARSPLPWTVWVDYWEGARESVLPGVILMMTPADDSKRVDAAP